MRVDLSFPQEITVTAQEYNREPSKVKTRSKDGPVFITERGVRAHVLLTYEAYQRLAPPQSDIVTALRMDDEDLADIEFERIGLDDEADFEDASL